MGCLWNILVGYQYDISLQAETLAADLQHYHYLVPGEIWYGLGYGLSCHTTVWCGTETASIIPLRDVVLY